jgi:hypothetical protein
MAPEAAAHVDGAVKRGRPREVIDPVKVSVLLPGTVYDEIDRLSRSLKKTVPAVIRDVISASQNRQTVEPSAQ